MERHDSGLVLVLLVTICMVPASLIAVVLLSFDYSRAREARIESSVTTARAIAYSVDKEFANTEASLRALATSPSLTRRDLPSFYQQAQDIQRAGLVQKLVLSDAIGRQLFNSRRPLGERLPSVADSTHLRLLTDTDGPVITPLQNDAMSGAPVIVISIPVRRAGQHIYNLSAHIGPENFARLLRYQQLSPDWIVAVLDSQGTIVARSHEMARFLGKAAAPMLRDAIGFDNEGWFEGKTSEGIDVLAIFSRSSVSNWSVAIGIPSEIIALELRKKLALLALAIAALLAGSLGAAIFIGTRIAKSIRALRAPALALGQGKEVRIPWLRLKESKELASALRQASLMLQAARHQATHDVLTGLANRALFQELVSRQIAICERSGTHFSILYIDLDGFKPVNDIHGHAAGDALLCEVAHRMQGALRDSDMAARLGGDEFAVILVGTAGSQATKVADNLISVLSAPYDFEGRRILISASTGVAGYPEAGVGYHELMRRADQAMYQAKEAGKGQTRCAGQ